MSVLHVSREDIQLKVKHKHLQVFANLAKLDVIPYTEKVKHYKLIALNVYRVHIPTLALLNRRQLYALNAKVDDFQIPVQVKIHQPVQFVNHATVLVTRVHLDQHHRMQLHPSAKLVNIQTKPKQQPVKSVTLDNTKINKDRKNVNLVN